MARRTPHDPLTRAAIRHGSDKYGGHLYTPVYHRLFGHLREAPIRLLEIGTGGYATEQAGGLGLRMWAEYFPYADITGLDLFHKTLDLPPRVKLYQGSQVDQALLAQLTQERGPFDIIVDDGSHMVSHMIDTFMFLYPRMAAHGIYAIEDTQTSFMSTTGGSTDGRNTIFDVAHRLSLAMHAPEGYADPDADPAYRHLAAITHAVAIHRNIVVFQRGSNTYPSNMHLDFTNAEVTRVFDDISAEAASNPSPYDAISRIDMLIWAGRKDEAVRLGLDAAARHPAERGLLHELLRMMEWAQSAPACATIKALLDRPTAV